MCSIIIYGLVQYFGSEQRSYIIYIEKGERNGNVTVDEVQEERKQAVAHITELTQLDLGKSIDLDFILIRLARSFDYS